MTINQKCENIKCPPIDEPVCVKLKNKHMNDIYIIAINKCELKYANCHKDIDAVIAPMVNCLHDDKKYQNISKKRNKRELTESSEDVDSVADSDDNKKDSDDNDDGNLALNEEMESDGNDDMDLLNGQDRDNGGISNENVKTLVEDDRNESKLDNNNKDNNKVQGALALFKVHVKEDDVKGDDVKEDDIKEDDVKEDDVKEDVDKDDVDKDDFKEDDVKEDGVKEDNVTENDAGSEINDNDIQMLTAIENVGVDYDQHVNEVDLDENDKECPTVCPTRDVMVCAKCRHHIHRTFLSLCHLRMFSCKHKDEKLQLVKREPCVQSAPFIKDYKETKGRIPQSGEPDEVHKFIFCREKDLLNEDDPRCRFTEKDK